MKRPLQKIKILVVDDDELCRYAAFEILNKLGAIVHTVPDASSALQFAQKQDLDFIFIDLHMPQTNGIELARCLFERDAEFRSKTAILTAEQPHHQIHEALRETGIQHMYSKPLDPKQFLETVRQIRKSKHHEQTSTFQGFPEIDGVDVTRGLQNFMNSAHAFQNTIIQFPRYGERFRHEFSQHARNCKYDECRRLAHSLKGSSLMIGALELYDLASQLEKALSTTPPAEDFIKIYTLIESAIDTVSQSVRVEFLSPPACD